MAFPTVTGLQALPDFATTINWNLSITSPPAMLSNPIVQSAAGSTSTSSSTSYTYNDDAINIRCESSDVPRKAGQSTTVMIRGLPVKQPGLYIPSQQINLSFVETVDNAITQFIWNWREACFNTNTGAQNTKADVIATVQLVRNDRQGNPIWQYTLTGCFLEAYDPGGSLQGQSAEAMRASISLSYDDYTEGSLATSGLVNGS